MGIWSADVLGNDAACEALRDLLDIAGYDVPPTGSAVTVMNERSGGRELLVRHEPAWYEKLRAAYRSLDPARVEKALPALVARAVAGRPDEEEVEGLERETPPFIFDLSFGRPGARQPAKRVCVGNGFMALSAVLLASGARAPKRLLQTCVAACEGAYDTMVVAARREGIPPGCSIRDSHGVACREAFLQLVLAHKPGTCRVLKDAVNADEVARDAMRPGATTNQWLPPCKLIKKRKVRVPSGALDAELPAEVLSWDRAFFAAPPPPTRITGKGKVSASTLLMTSRLRNDENKDHYDATMARMLRSSERTCGTCGKPAAPGKKLHGCAGCHSVWYCDATCQKADWRAGGHKARCKKLAAARAAIKASERRADASAV